MIQVLIAIVVVSVLIYVGIMLYQRYLSNNLTKLIDRKNKLQDETLERKIREIGALKLSGSAQSEFENNRDNYNNIIGDKIPAIDQIIDVSKDQVRDLKFVDVHRNINNLNHEIDEDESKISNINEQLDVFKKIDQENHEAVKVFKMRHQELRKKLVSNYDILGSSGDTLEKKLSSINGEFESFKNDVNEGDQSKASDQLSGLQEQTNELEKNIEEIPPYYERLSKVFPEQLDEIKDTYTKLINRNYAFDNDNILNELDSIKMLINENHDMLSHLRLDAVHDNNEKIAKKIEVLYDELQNEMDSRKEVDRNFEIITDFITHAENRNKVLTDETTRLDHSYVLSKEDLNQVNVLNTNLESIRSKHDRATEQIANQPVIYSKILEQLHHQNQELKEIEEKQTELSEILHNVVRGEKIARQKLVEYFGELNHIKQHVEKLNIPGISSDYEDFYYIVEDELSKASENMNQVRINIPNINRELDMVDTDLQTLVRKTTELTDNAALTELSIQYANRYRDKDFVQDGINKSQRYFDYNHRYNQSLETISEILDKVEKGAVEAIKENYFKNKHTDY